jgi:hypothetical protein
MTMLASDRRAACRHTHIEEHGVVVARIRPGHHARIVDISVGGALVDTAHRLLPGRHVDLLLETANRRAATRGRVLRCAVVGVRPSAICYRGAIAFDRPLHWLAEGEREFPPVPAAGTSNPHGAHATPQVV